MKKIKSFKIFCNDNKKSDNIANIVRTKLLDNGLIESDKYDMAIAIGGDGSFLRMMHDTNFNSEVIYAGINAGTLGFAQEVPIDRIDDFVKDIKIGNYKIDSIGIQKTKVVTKAGESNFNSLNEILVRDKDLKTVVLNIYIDNVFLENYHGDGILVATSFGSTAYNLSFGGSIIYNTFHTLQITPIAPLNNKAYRSLLNSVILPKEKIIKIVPENKDLLLTIDGENHTFNNVSYIETTSKDKEIKCFRGMEYNFALKINEKFLK